MVRGKLRRQFDVYTNPDKSSSAFHPYLIVLQSDALTDISTCVVAPLSAASDIKTFDRAIPQVSVRNQQFLILVPALAAVPARTIGTAITNLEAERYRIIRAIDLVFTGV